MNIRFLDISNKCRKPTVAILKEALEERINLSDSESNFITYMAGFSHYEFAESLLNEFGLIFICDRLIVFDSINRKFHIKVLINDLMDLPCFGSAFDTIEIPENEEDPIIYTNSSFANVIAWRNKDRSWVDNIYKEVKNLNYVQYQEYRDNHIIGVNERIFPYELVHEGIICVIHITTIQRNIHHNLAAVLDRVSNAMFINDDDNQQDLSIRPDLSIYKLRKNKDIYCLLRKINWNVLEIEAYKDVTTFFDEINANYIVNPYRGEEYNYFADFISNALTCLIEKINLSNLI
jgi:hypothetical protein